MTKTLVFLLMFFASVLQAMNSSSLSGFVFDAASRESIPGANVYLPGQRLGSSSNRSGYYVIPNLPAGE